MKSPVFIIGGSRTGSELLKGILEKYTDYAFVNEMHLLSPQWLHKDFDAVIRSEIGGYGPSMSATVLIELIKRGMFFGYFWKEFDQVIDEMKFCERFDSTDKQLKDVLDVSMQLYAANKDKPHWGAKFPVHYSFVDKLLEWYPDCRIIHTVRDPRAVYASQSTKYTKHAKGYIDAARIRFKQFVHINIQSKWTYKVHTLLSTSENYHLALYEKLVCETERYFRDLCVFLDIDFKEDLLNPTAYSNSSFESRKGSGRSLQREALDAYKKVINPSTIKLIEFINRTEMKGLGYLQ